mmetsp:Transcript_16923/g.20111  ORF Transcript_16923/g.20111 Transcript_16923/m.20111 type:complete len:165 (+) Transcript_16923:3256-3750(+)
MLDNATSATGNKLGREDLWIEVSKSRCHPSHERFVPCVPSMHIGILKTNVPAIKMGQRILILEGGNKTIWAIFLGLKDNSINIISYHSGSQIFCMRAVCANKLIHADPEKKKRKRTRFEDLNQNMLKACKFAYSSSSSESINGAILAWFYSTWIIWHIGLLSFQ